MIANRIGKWIGTTATLAAIVGTSLVATGSASAGTATDTDVMAWLDAVDPAITVDQSTNCMAGATDAVAYRNDRIVLRTSASNATAAGVVTAQLNPLRATPRYPV